VPAFIHQLGLGELAALGAALCWVFTSLAFAAAGRRLGSTAVNLIRIYLALIALFIIHRLVLGAWLPAVDARALHLLVWSGIIGLAIGDQFLFTAFVDVGPRISLLLMTIAPPTAAIIAWPALGETLGPVEMLGIAITMAGVAWVILERRDPARRSAAHGPHRIRGFIFAGLGGVCQAIGLVLSKMGMGHTAEGDALAVDPWAATLVRMAAAAVGIAILAPAIMLVKRRNGAKPIIDISPETEHLPAPPAGAQRSLGFAMVMVLIGVTFGPVVGVWCSMVAVDLALTGVAATLMAITPVLILPFAVVVEKEHISWRAVLGAIIAVAGVALLTTT
jgi:drug/metabolite transporter (DMT)-like permease